MVNEITGYIRREAEAKIKSWLNEGYIVAVLGARQTGKTTLINKIKSEIKRQTFYYLFDDVLLRGKVAENFYYLQEDIEAKLGTSLKKYQDKITVFLDEAQKVPEVFELVKIWHDTLGEKIEIILSGSASLEIQKNQVKV